MTDLTGALRGAGKPGMVIAKPLTYINQGESNGIRQQSNHSRKSRKRPLMAKTAEAACAHVILTNEDPYDEDPMEIIEEMKTGMTSAPEIIMDRTQALRAAFVRAAKTPGSTVLITGKGTDPYIMEKGGKKTPWDDREKARAVLVELGYAREQ
jgi:UDP-N-acetylmuramyl tripeptide synthase